MALSPLDAQLMAGLAGRDAINVRQYGVTGDGTTDDTDKINIAFEKCYQRGAVAWFPPTDNYYKVSATVGHDKYPLVMGYGKQNAVIRATANTFHILKFGDGDEQVPGGGFIQGLGVRGASRPSPDGNGYSAICLDAVHGCLVADNDLNYVDIGIRFMNNCYQCDILRNTAYAGRCNVCCYLGGFDGSVFQSGSDILVQSNWFSGQIAAVCIGPNGGGYHICYGQKTVGQGAGSSAGSLGAIVAGYNYMTGAKGYCTFDLTEISFEGGHKDASAGTDVSGYFIRTFEEMAMTMHKCRFNGTTTSTEMMVGLIRSTDVKNSKVSISSCGVKGNFSGRFDSGNGLYRLWYLDGAVYEGFSPQEQPWDAASGELNVNSVSVGMNSILQQSGMNIGSCAPWATGGSGSYETHWLTRGKLHRIAVISGTTKQQYRKADDSTWVDIFSYT